MACRSWSEPAITWMRVRRKSEEKKMMRTNLPGKFLPRSTLSAGTSTRHSAANG